MKQVNFISSNPEKLEAARKAFQDTDIQLKQVPNRYPEIQADSSLEIARHTARKASKDFDSAVIREDHSMFLEAVPGFPGPYISYFDDELPVEKLLKLLENAESRKAKFVIATVLYDGEFHEFETEVGIEIAEQPRGDSGNWNKVLKLENAEKTFAESDPGQRLEIWNRNLRRVAEKLSDQS
ncbi:MAG: non-canonical purine NTP pyrophosphatase [Candidatus Nanohaloarchaea archaeon]